MNQMPDELVLELGKQGIHPSDVSDWKKVNHRRYEVRLKPSAQQVNINIVRSMDRTEAGS